ncbi:hypothetical protein Tco_1071220, partial [Tanacetum coccineum]
MSPHTASQMTWHSKERVDDGLMRLPVDRHRRWLKENNKLRRDKAAFNGEPEWDPRPRVLSGSELLDQLKDVETVYKKEDVFKKRKREELEKENERERKAALRSEKRKMKEKMKGKGKMNVKVKQKATNSNEKEGNEHERQDNWKKKSIFFELVYWDFLPIRHNLDVMHIEKNVCDNVLFTLLGIAGKTKDHLNARLDLKELNIRPSLHPQETNSSRILLPPACFTLGKDEKYQFLKLLKD